MTRPTIDCICQAEKGKAREADYHLSQVQISSLATPSEHFFYEPEKGIAVLRTAMVDSRKDGIYPNINLRQLHQLQNANVSIPAGRVVNIQFTTTSTYPEFNSLLVMPWEEWKSSGCPVQFKRIVYDNVKCRIREEDGALVTRV